MKLDNLIWLNLSKNKIKNHDFISKSLKNLKILIMEENSIDNLNEKALSNLENIELLSLGSNTIQNIEFFNNKNKLKKICGIYHFLIII